jgi:predicted transcriptional regulator
MANKVKDDWLGGRVDSDLKERVEEYIESAEITQGQLIRKAVIEYIKNHPVEAE